MSETIFYKESESRAPYVTPLKSHTRYEDFVVTHAKTGQGWVVTFRITRANGTVSTNEIWTKRQTLKVFKSLSTIATILKSHQIEKFEVHLG